MFVTYAPADGDTQRWEFDPAKVRASKAEMIEKRFGGSWDQWQAAVQQGSIKARRVLLWHLLTVDHPTLRNEDVPDFYAGEVTVEHSVAELRAIRERVEKSSLSDEDKDPIFTALDGEITEAMAREESDRHAAEPLPEDGSADDDDETVGKARSKNGARSTS